jgi:hypothetical protein
VRRARYALGAALGFAWGILLLAFTAGAILLLFGWRGIDY